MPISRPSLVDLALIAVALVWGASFAVAKDLTEQIGVAPALALRFLIAAAATSALCAARRIRPPSGRALAVAALLGGSQAAAIGLETWGVHLTSATNAGLLISLALVFTPALESVASRVRLPRSSFVAAVGAVVGVALLVSDEGLSAPNAGDALVILAALVRAAHVTASGRLTRDLPDSSIGVILVQMCVCAIVFSALAGPDLADSAVALDGAGWLRAGFLGLLCSLFAFLVQLWAVRRTSATRASILMGTEPLWALLVGVAVAGEAIGPAGAIGAAVLIAASYLGQAAERRHRLAGPRGEPATAAAPER